MLRLLLLFLGYCFCACEKRLLLTDQDVVHSLQHELQTLHQKLQQLETTQNQLSSENNALKRQMSAENTALKTQLTALESIKALSTYVVWGRKTWPQKNGTSLIYSGIMSGKQWNEQGSGVSALCLPHDPESANSDFPSSSPSDGLFANIWGSEYQFSYRHVSLNDDAPCAVCQVQSRSTLMIPAKRNCPSGWHVEYRGALVSAASNEYAFEYLCIDENPEYFEGTRNHNDNGLTLHPVRSRCGSLPCPPYADLQYLSCVVCSQ